MGAQHLHPCRQRFSEPSKTRTRFDGNGLCSGGYVQRHAGLHIGRSFRFIPTFYVRYECGGIRVSAGVLGRKRLRLRRGTVELARQCRLILASYIVASDPVTVRGPEPDVLADWHGHSAEAEDSAVKTPDVFLAQVLRIKFMN